MERRLTKRGISHIEVIISFVVFVGFLFFLFAFIKPVRNTEISQTILDLSQQGIEDYTNVNYSYISVKLSDSLVFDGKLCFAIPISIDNGRIVVKDKKDVEVNSGADESKIYISQDSEKFYTIYASSVFELKGALSDCKDLVKDTDYSLGFLSEYQVLSNESIFQLKERYDSNEDYISLKRYFKIPDSNNFGFSIRETNGDEIISAMRSPPARISVIARDVPSQLIYKTGEIKFVIMNVQAW